MLIEKEKCIGCGKCVPYCPMNAIILHKKNKTFGEKSFVEIDLDECVECAACLRADVCPSGAIHEVALFWPRSLRKDFSDPLKIHKGTDVPGRGTEEMKTNDVTGRFKDGYVGIGLEFGRPGIGTRLSETEKAIKKLLPLGVEFEAQNPLTQLISDKSTGELQNEVRCEKVLSAIVECVAPIEKAQAIFAAVKELDDEVDTVFSLDLICKVTEDGQIPIIREIEMAGLTRSTNGKVNCGLGQPLFAAC